MSSIYDKHKRLLEVKNKEIVEYITRREMRTFIKCYKMTSDITIVVFNKYSLEMFAL